MEALAKNMAWLIATLCPRKKLIIMNASEVDFYHSVEKDRWRHHKECNLLLDGFKQISKNLSICDVRKYVKTTEDVTDNIRHYQRRIYLQLAGEIERIAQEKFSVERCFPERKQSCSHSGGDYSISREFWIDVGQGDEYGKVVEQNKFCVTEEAADV